MSAMEVSVFIPPYNSVSKSEQSASSLSTENISNNPKQDDLVKPIESNENVEQSNSSLLSEFQQLFNNFDYETIREKVLDRQLIECRFFTVLWRIFLHCLPRDPSQWNDMLSITRNTYTDLRQKYSIDPRTKCSEDGIRAIVNHPLSQHPNSDWRQFHDDNDFKRSIKIDVCRTYPNVDFFRNENIINLQTEVLFIHSRHHSNSCDYRQGMHEILGMIIYIMHTESTRVFADPESNEVMRNLYDPQFLEHDSYAIFEKIMVHLRQYYTRAAKPTPPIQRSKSVKDMKQQPFEKKKPPPVEVNENVNRMKSLFGQLSHYDKDLHNILTELQIEPTVYGIRWLRLMFSREVPFESIPILWNVIFCFDEHFNFINHIFLVLLMEFKPLIFSIPNPNDTDCLHILMKANVIANVEPLIQKALRQAGRQIPLSSESALANPIPPTPDPEMNNLGTVRENSVRTAKIQRVPIQRSNEPRLTRPKVSTNSKKTESSAQSSNENHLSGEAKTNSNHPFPTSKGSSEDHLDHPSAIDLELWSGKTAQQQYDENVRLQKNCADYMSKFVGRMERLVSDLELPNEDELLITISGLKQIAHVLEGSLVLDHDTLKKLLNYQSGQMTNRSNNTDHS